MKNLIHLLIFIFHSAILFSQEDIVWMNPNRGQWHQNIQYSVDLAGGKMYIEKDGFTYHYYTNPRQHHDGNHDHDHHEPSLLQHVVRSKFIGSSWGGFKQESKRSSFYKNYFIGEDESKWKSEVYSYANIQLKDFYPQIDLVLEGAVNEFKYSFSAAPNANTQVIKWQLTGADKVYIDVNGNLVIKTSLGSITELAPKAWTESTSGRRDVPVKFKLTGKTVQYEFPNGYSTNERLIIDPSLVFSTYSGSISDNWGMTATPGPNGEMFAGGIAFGAGYPVSSGAIDNSYNGGTNNGNIPGFDVAISKFSATGNQLMYSTYLGGTKNELPQSMIVTAAGELFVLGITASTDFPIANNPFQNNFAGGPTATHNGLTFVGSDIFISRFNTNGTQLLASTYVGGSGLDGLNTSQLAYNYGDQYRGEIILQGGHLLIASHSQSPNFPSTANSLQGTQDAVVFKIDHNLQTIVWSRYLGGSGNETGNSLALNSEGDLFIVGGTTSSNFTFNNSPNFAGDRDGYIARINSLNGELDGGVLLGTSAYDQCYFVSIDLNDKVYVFGQTRGFWQISPGKYGNPNSGQFIRKYSENLGSIEWTTLIGAGSGTAEISPTAFMVSDCYDIFFAGWGGTVNSQAPGSSSNGFPITSDAHQSSTNGSNFYLGILNQDATSLIYGTYFGGFTSSSNHVDGGTSRFDKSGAIYHAVCASCGGLSNGFVSTPGVWSQTNKSTNCNMAAFKFQMGMPYSLSASTYACLGESVQLNATGGTTFSWSPASTLNNPNIPNPIATPDETTVYYVTMNFNEGCAITDSIVIEVVKEPIIELSTTESICVNDTLSLTASGGISYFWSPDQTISSTTTSSTQVWPSTSMYYYVTVSNQCFEKTDSIWVNVHPIPEIILVDDTIICKGGNTILSPVGGLSANWTAHPTLEQLSSGNASVQPTQEMYYYVTGVDENGCTNMDSVYVHFYPIPPIEIIPDTTICDGTTVQLFASGGQSYLWSPANSLDNPLSQQPIASPSLPTTYKVEISYGENCILIDSVQVNLMYLPLPTYPDSIVACFNTPTTINVGGADSYSWSPSTYLNTTSGPTVVTTPLTDLNYVVTFTNLCGALNRTIPVTVIHPSIQLFHDTIICPGQTAQLFATGALYYEWSPNIGLSNTMTSMVQVTPPHSMYYICTGTDQNGCRISDSVLVELYPQPYIFAGEDHYLLEGDVAQLSAQPSGSGSISWYPTEFLTCVNCLEPVAYPPTDFKYTVTLIDENGCTDSDELYIFFDPLIYVPNTFTPNGDGFNEGFRVMGGNVKNFQFLIFDRWGEKIFESKSMNEAWDGTYKGVICQDGTYTWKLKYSDFRGNEHMRTGHVNLVR